ncbi:Hermansky-Pudlak syndrome 5 protein [Apis mellifera carnica]|nr:Hermansky-Pudlak syndrome 5 protein [Apis mellifera carnica]
MQEYPYVLSEYEEINPLLYKPINSTQRIKYTCFNVSSNYILLGSTSGSIYLFSRKPCSFIQLIPLSEGIVSRILISPDEKTIALTTVRGIVCLVVLKPTPKLIAISTEHIHKQINCLCWNDNSSEIYIGDENGKISVLVLSIFTVNDSGIVVVNCGNSNFKDEETFMLHPVSHCSLQDNEDLFKIEMETSINLLNDSDKKVKKDEDANYNTLKEIEESQNETRELNTNKSITQKIQEDLQIIYALVDNIKSSIEEEELEKIILDIDWNMNVIKDSYQNLTDLKNFMYEVLRSVELHYFNVLLENISIQLIQIVDNENIIKQIIKAFVNVNIQSRRCTCGSPYPINELIEPKFLDIDGKHWSLVASYAKEIQQGQCLFCGKSIKKENHEELINWTAVIYEIMKKQGPDIAMTLLMKLEKAIPNISIDRSIFQSLIFTKLLYQHGMKYTINFNKHNLESSKYNTICSTKIRDQLVGVLEKDLNKSINRNIFENGAHHWGMYYQNKLSTCSCCTLSLQTPVLLGNNGIAIFDCGHAYHVNCMIEKKLTACNLHS